MYWFWQSHVWRHVFRHVIAKWHHSTFSLNLFTVLLSDATWIRLQTSTGNLMGEQNFADLLFISINVSFRKTVSWNYISVYFHHHNFRKSIIKFCKCEVCVGCTLNKSHSSKFTSISGSTISPSSVDKVWGVFLSCGRVEIQSEYFQKRVCSVTRGEGI